MRSADREKRCVTLSVSNVFVCLFVATLQDSSNTFACYCTLHPCSDIVIITCTLFSLCLNAIMLCALASSLMFLPPPPQAKGSKKESLVDDVLGALKHGSADHIMEQLKARRGGGAARPQMSMSELQGAIASRGAAAAASPKGPGHARMRSRGAGGAAGKKSGRRGSILRRTPNKRSRTDFAEMMALPE